jgi:SAM-dependent methyltransferase
VKRVIHLGCGRDKENIFHRNGAPIDKSLIIVGVDRDLESLMDYPGKLRVLADLEHLPFASETFGLGASEEVFEHIAHPHVVGHEIFRVLMPGGILQFCTPSKYSYVSILAKITPLWFHRLIQIAMNPGEYRETDVFPKYYRLNSKHEIDACFVQAGMECWRFRYWDGGPWMLRVHPVLVRLGMVYHRILRRFRSLSFLSNVIIGAYKRL